MVKGLRLRLRSALAAWLLAPALALAAGPTNPVSGGHIGIEGRLTIDLPGGDYQPRPLDDRTGFILRIESITPAGNGQFRYHFHYMGLDAESFRLADYLMRPDGSRPDELAAVQVSVRATLPEDHNGQLTRFAPARFPFIGGYRVMLGVGAALWLAGLAAFVWSYRKKRVPVMLAPVVPEPTFAERLRPFVEAAAQGRLTLEEKAQLERLLMGFWRARLNLPELRMADAIAHLRQHAEAGALLQALERWLHQRAGASAAEINSLLEPYRHTP